VLTPDSVTIDLAASNVEYVKANAGDDTLDGSGQAANLSLYGQGGDDVLTGGSGNDRLYGNDGADQLYGGAGNDSLYIDGDDTVYLGGEGVDRIFVLSSESVSLDLAANSIEYAKGNEGDDTLDGSGATANISLYGQGGNDILSSGTGADRLYGGDGSDTLTASSGSDRLYGNDGDDILIAGDGADRLYAGAGDDQLSGGLGTDIFYFYGDAGANVISDYSAFEKLVFTGSDFTADALHVIADGNNAVVTFDNVTDFELTVENVDAADFDAAQGSTTLTLDFNTVI